MSTYQSGESPVYSLNRLFYKIRQIENKLIVLDTGSTSSLTKAQADTFYKPIDYVPAFSVITGKPTTLSGYGITDAFTQTTADGRYRPISYVPTFASITSKPTTLSGYGITDAYPLTGNPSNFLTSVPAQSFSSLTGKPTTISGYGITDAFTQATADTLYRPISYVPAFADITAKPTTINGYGITDSVTLTGTQTVTNKTFSGASNTFSNVPNTAVTGLGTMSTQNSTAVAITGGTITGLTTLSGTGNPVFDAGTGTNTLTLRTGTISHNGGNFTMSGGVVTSGGIASARFTTSGNETNTGTTLGMKGMFPAFTGNDGTTAASGTAAFSSNFSLGVPTLTATNTAIITTNAANLYIAGDPIAGTNQTLTNSYGLYNLGKSYFGANIVVNASTVLNGTLFASVLKNNGANGFDFQSSAGVQWARFVSATGNLLINTTTDNTTDKLQVNGSINATANIISSSYLQGQRVFFTGNTSLQGSLAGVQAQFNNYTNNDNTTAASGTIAHTVSHAIGIPTFNSTNTGVTYTNGSNLYIAGPPTAGTNVTITNPWAVYVANGNSYFNGNVTSTGATFSNSYRSNGQDLSIGNSIGTVFMRLMSTSTGDLILQNGGTFTDIVSSRLTINSTTQGIKIPQMTAAQKTAIASPVSGLLVDQSDGTAQGLQRYNGTTWQPVSGVQGNSVQSGNGTTTSFTIAHGLGYVPTFVNVEAGSNDADGTLIKYRSADATNITIVYKTAPVTGTNNLTFYYTAK